MNNLWLEHAEWASYWRKGLSPAALRTSSSSWLVAAIATFAASVWRCPWLASKVSLLIPPLGSILLVWSIAPPWLHFPVQQRHISGFFQILSDFYESQPLRASSRIITSCLAGWKTCRQNNRGKGHMSRCNNKPSIVIRIWFHVHICFVYLLILFILIALCTELCWPQAPFKCLTKLH